VGHRLLDVSLGGARLDGAYTGEEGDWVMIDFAGLHLPATVVRRGASEVAVRFDDVGEGRTDLIRLVYSGRYSAAVTHIEPRRVAAAVLERVMR
jgi:hypothetical protein